ncbi:MAG: hypothetical protein ACXQTS_05815 [Candidatus Methanospirareceae archaeon]
MKVKRCCYMDRECSEDCVAYMKVKEKELRRGLRDFGIADMRCLRLFVEFVSMIEKMRMMMEEDIAFEEFEEIEEE